MSDYIIQVENLVKKFGNLVAVNDISFNVSPGEIFGFLGPNGAGKTTTINILCTLARPTAGKAVLNGFDVVRQQNQVRQSIGIVFQDPSLDDRLTGLHNLRFHAMVYNVPVAVREQRIEHLLRMVELWDKRKNFVNTYSGGMKRRLELARGLLHSPKVLFLDEPTLGLDPQTRNRIWEYVLELRKHEGTTVFLTTHYMDEAEKADRIAIIDYGRIVALGTPAELKNEIGGDVVTISLDEERPFDLIELVLSAGARYAACYPVTQPAALSRAIERAIVTTGFTFVEALTPCPSPSRAICGPRRPGRRSTPGAPRRPSVRAASSATSTARASSSTISSAIPTRRATSRGIATTPRPSRGSRASYAPSRSAVGQRRSPPWPPRGPYGPEAAF